MDVRSDEAAAGSAGVLAGDHDMRTVLKAARRVARAFDIQSRRVDREIGLTIPQFVVLACVGDLGEVTSKAVSDEAGLSPPTVVGILDKLAAKGLIERYRSQRDRRIVHASVTEKGRATLDAAPALLGEGFQRRFSALPVTEREALLSALGRLATMLQDADDAV
jgi:DNA-binding MarR family transcriptional regulator